jgi:hypothetical protein
MRSALTVAAIGLLAAGLARADGPTAVSLRVGDQVNVCKSGLSVCPVSSFLCDDPKIAIVENGAEGAVLKGLSPGTTLCSLLGYATASRRVIQVTVSARGGQE